MTRLNPTNALAGGLLVLASAFTPVGLSQGADASFYRAFYLQHEAGDLEGAQKLYLEALESRSLDRDLQLRAKAELKSLNEDLAASDFAKLMPSEAILYVELNRPGAQVSALLDQLGLLRKGSDLTAFGVSPALLEGALGMRGAALAVTEIDMNGGPPEAVLILHPGDRDAVRGLLETALPTAGAPGDSIGGHPTWSIEGQAHVTLTSRLLIASTSPKLVEGVLARLEGDGLQSLATSPGFAKVDSLRGDDLLFFHVNAEPVLPMLRYALEQEARNDPDAAMAMNFVDIDSLRSLSGRIGVGSQGLGLDVALTLADGHRNLLFNLLRTPAVSQDTLALVPDGAAFFYATSFNEAAPVAPVGGTSERPIVTGMDFGREVFANLVDVVVYGLPPEGNSAQGGGLPDLVACLRVNDASRSKALWNFVLGLASQSTGAESMEPESLKIAGVPAERYSLEGIPVYLVTRDHEMLISPSRAALERTLKARKKGRSVMQDELFARCLETLPHESTTALVLSPGRCAAMALPFVPGGDADELRMAAQLLNETIVCVGVEHSDTRLAVSARVGHLPDVSGLVAQAIRQQHSHGQRQVAEAKSSPAAPQRAGAESLRKKFDELSRKQQSHEAAVAVGEALIATLADDPTELNDFAWALLTEKRYGERFTPIALVAARKANNLTAHSNWALLDTLAWAEFGSGNVDRAIELEKTALQLVKGSGREAEVERALKRFIEAKHASKKGAATVSAR